MNSSWALVVSLILIASSVLARGINRDGSRPLIWHNNVWLATLLLYATNLIAYDSSSSTAWLVLLSGLLAFNVASIAALPRRRDSVFSANEETVSLQPLLSRRVLFFACTVYLVSFGFYLYSIHSNYGIGVLFTDPGSIRAISLDGESYLSRTPQLARLGLNLGPVLLVVFAVRESVQRPLGLLTRSVMLLMLMATMLAMLQRTNLFMAILWYLAYTMSRHHIGAVDKMPVRGRSGLPAKPDSASINDKRKKGFMVAAAGGAIVLVLAFQLMGSALGKTGQQALSTDRVSPELEASGLSNIYVYATAAVPAFLKLVESPNEQWPPERVPGQQIVGDYNPQTYGVATLGPLTEFVPGVREWNPIAPFMNVGILTNVFTWYEHPYRDFRLPGVVVFAFIMGFVSTRMFTHRFRSAQIYWTQSAVFSTLFLSTFVAKIGTAIFWVGLLFVAIVALRSRPVTSCHSEVLDRS